MQISELIIEDNPFIIKAIEYLPGGCVLDDIWNMWQQGYRKPYDDKGILPAGVVVVQCEPHYYCPTINYTVYPTWADARKDGKHFQYSLGAPQLRYPLVGLTAHSVRYIDAHTNLLQKASVSVLTAGVVDARLLPCEPTEEMIKLMPRIQFLHLGERGERIYPYTQEELMPQY